jgi:hypothetical protein
MKQGELFKFGEKKHVNLPLLQLHENAATMGHLGGVQASPSANALMIPVLRPL